MDEYIQLFDRKVQTRTKLQINGEGNQRKVRKSTTTIKPINSKGKQINCNDLKIDEKEIKIENWCIERISTQYIWFGGRKWITVNTYELRAKFNCFWNQFLWGDEECGRKWKQG